MDSLITYMKWASDNMGLQFDKESATKAAFVMLDWKHHIEEKPD